MGRSITFRRNLLLLDYKYLFQIKLFIFSRNIILSNKLFILALCKKNFFSYHTRLFLCVAYQILATLSTSHYAIHYIPIQHKVFSFSFPFFLTFIFYLIFFQIYSATRIIINIIIIRKLLFIFISSYFIIYVYIIL